MVLRDLNLVEEYTANNGRVRFRVKTPTLTTDDFVPKEISEHTCAEKSIAEQYEDMITEHGLKIAEVQKQNSMNNRSVFTSEVLDQILTSMAIDIPEQDLKELRSAANEDKVNLRKIETRIAKALRKPKSDEKIFNLDNQFQLNSLFKVFSLRLRYNF